MKITDGSVLIGVNFETDDALKKLKEFNKDTEKALNQATNQQKKHAAEIAKAHEDAYKRVGKAAKAAFAAAATAITAFAAAGIKFNSDMESYLTSFTVMLDDADKAAQHLENLKNMAAKTPFGLDDLASASQTLQAFGVSIDEIMPSLQQLGDISLGNKDRFNSLALVFGQVAAAGKLTGQDLLQFVNAGFNPLQTMAEKTGKSMAELRDEMSAGKITYEMVADAIKTATDEGGKFHNAMEEQSKTIKGLTSTAYDNFKQLSGEIMQPITDLIRDELLPNTIRWMQSFDAEKAAQGLSTLLTILKDMLPVITGIVTTIATHQAIFALPKLLENIKKGLTALTADPIVLLISVLAGLSAALVKVAWDAGETRREVEALNKEYEKNVAALEASREAAINDAESVEVLTDEAIALNDEIKAGGMADEEAAAKKQELIDKVNELNSKSEDFQFTINTETGLINENTEAVKALTNAYVNMAKAKANADAYQQMRAESLKAELEAQKKIDELEEKNKTKQREVATKILKNEFKKEWNGFDEELQNDLISKYIKEHTGKAKSKNDAVTNISSLLSTDDTKALEEAKRLKAESQADQKKFEAEMDKYNTQYYQTKATYTKLQNDLFGGTKKPQSGGTGGTGGTDDPAQDRLKKQQEAAKKADDLRKQEQEAAEKHNAELLKAQKQADEEFIKTLDKANSDKLALEKEYAEKVLQIQDQLERDIKNLWDDYQSKLQTRSDSLYNAFGLFDKPENASSTSIRTLQRNLDAQIKIYEKYFDDLAKLRERADDEKLKEKLIEAGLDTEDYQAFIEDLQNMGVSARAEVAAISAAGNKELARYISSHKKKHDITAEEAETQLLPTKLQIERQSDELKTAAQTAIDELSEQLTADIQALYDDISQTVYAYVPETELLGQALADGIIAGLESRGNAVSQAMRDLLNDALDSGKEEMEIHSPSAKMRREVGAQMGKGVTLGIREQLAALSSDELIAIGTRLRNAFNATLWRYTPGAGGNAFYTKTLRTETVQTINNNNTSTVRLVPDTSRLFKLVSDEQERQGDSF